VATISLGICIATDWVSLLESLVSILFLSNFQNLSSCKSTSQILPSSLGVENVGSYRSEKENVDEDILSLGTGQ
jgi:hypothetical protein